MTLANSSDIVTVDKILELTTQLSVADKLRLIERIVPQIDREVKAIRKPQSLRGIWRGLDITDEDIQGVRTEMWRNFPREDI
ncbi:MAG: hypothetical protein R2911_26990 [Caldilineaceae bacterium]